MLHEAVKIKYPKWHEDARRMRDGGMKVIQITNTLAESGIKVSAARVSQVTNAGWQGVAEADRLRKRREYQHKAKEEPVANERHFEKVSAKDPSDVHHRVRVRCSHDDCKNTMIFAKRGVIHPTQAAQWFRDKGWGVGGGPRADLCPDHYKRMNNGHALEALPEPVEPETMVDTIMDKVVHIPSVKSPPPTVPVLDEEGRYLGDQMAAMTRTDRRLINAKLNDVYVDEERGYRDDWSDQKVAEDLGASVLWVAAIREENFGPDINEADVLREREMAVVIEAFKTVAAEALAAIKEYDQKVEQIDAKLDAFDKVHAEFTALLIRHERKKT